VFIVLILAGYLGVAYITYATQGIYTYAFLDTHNGHSGLVAGYCFGILAAACIIFLVVKGLIASRRWLTETKMGKMGKFKDGISEKGYINA